jgi:uncharacterized protein with von Willebrand factor type A (vWA) domain
MTDHALVRTPAGEIVDGRRLLAEAVSFGRALRAEGLGIDLGAAVDFARALTLVELGEREQVRAAGSAVFVRRRDDREVYDRVFDRFWRRRRLGLGGDMVDGPLRREDGAPADDPDATAEAERGDERGLGRQDIRGTPIPGDDDDETLGSDVEGLVVAPDAFSASEVLRHRDFDRMTAAELRDAERLVDLLEPRLERRRTRRYELHHHGRILAARAMLDVASAGSPAAAGGGAVRHLRLHGAPLATLAAVRPGARRIVRGADRVVRVRYAAHQGHSPHARP